MYSIGHFAKESVKIIN